ncbi:MAG: rhomboid family intramembrane serine protease [Bacteroidales bacterium]|nr:rhomboid family intramembrane serine protease [Bacteroidales bacterium]
MITPIIIAITAAISILAFGNENLFQRLQLNPYLIHHRNQFHRIITHGFLHADWIHLLVNMIVLFSFGSAVENRFDILEHKGMISNPILHFLILYFIGMMISTFSTIRKYKDNFNYNAIGASGAVSAVVFAFILFSPTNTLLLMGIIPIPAIVFGVLYLVYSQYMRRKSGGNVNHDAHFIGAVFGFIYPILLEPNLIRYFFNQIF